MPHFGLVCEGMTDHAVISNILIGYFGPDQEPEIFRDHPNPFSEEHHGGWTLVLNYLRNKKYQQAFQHNKYLIIQIDTDISEDIGFNVPKQDQSGPLGIEAFIDNVISKLQAEIGSEDLERYGDRFIFAIGVEQLECWILPLWHADNKGTKTANCLKKLSNHPQLAQKLKRGKFEPMSENSKDYFTYEFASKPYQKKKTLLKEGRRNPSLARFLSELDRRNIQL